MKTKFLFTVCGLRFAVYNMQKKIFRLFQIPNSKFKTLNLFLLPIAYCLLPIALTGCHGDYSPKPKAYPRIVLPQKEYELYDSKDCPFKFEKPVYAQVVPDTAYYGTQLISN